MSESWLTAQHCLIGGKSFMARISGAKRNTGSLLRRVYVGLVYYVSRRRLGRLILPLQVTAHHGNIFWGYTQMERAQMASKLVDAKLKDLVELRVATLVGCPF
jgi:hypothetical protein